VVADCQQDSCVVRVAVFLQSPHPHSAKCHRAKASAEEAVQVLEVINVFSYEGRKGEIDLQLLILLA
jgi:hypothetical protein